MKISTNHLTLTLICVYMYLMIERQVLFEYLYCNEDWKLFPLVLFWHPYHHLYFQNLQAHQMAAARCNAPQYQIARVHPLPASTILQKHANMPRHRLDPGDIMTRPWALTQRELEVSFIIKRLVDQIVQCPWLKVIIYPWQQSLTGCSTSFQNEQLQKLS